jgi:hypothetical protein
VELTLFGIGLASFVFLVSQIGLAEATSLAGRLGPWIIPIVGLGFVPHALDTLGLFLCLLDRGQIGLGYTFAGRLAGEALNTVLPTATVGGEVVKASILGRRAPLERVAAGVGLTYAVDAFSTMALAALALPVSLPRLDLPVSLRIGIAGLVIAGLLGTSTFLHLVHAGRVHAVLRRLGVIRERTDPASAAVPRRVVAGAALALLASTLWSAVEVGIVRYALTGERDLADALAIASLSAFVDAVFFFVPGQIGTREGGLAAITALFGLGSSLGITIALVRRLTQVAWALLGYVSFAWLQRSERLPLTSPEAVTAG